MKQIQTIEKGANFSAANFGNLAAIKDYVLELGPEVKIPEKGSAVRLSVQTAENFHFRYLLPVRKPDSCTPTRIMKNYTFS